MYNALIFHQFTRLLWIVFHTLYYPELWVSQWADQWLRVFAGLLICGFQHFSQTVGVNYFQSKCLISNYFINQSLLVQTLASLRVSCTVHLTMGLWTTPTFCLLTPVHPVTHFFLFWLGAISAYTLLCSYVVWDVARQFWLLDLNMCDSCPVVLLHDSFMTWICLHLTLCVGLSLFSAILSTLGHWCLSNQPFICTYGTHCRVFRRLGQDINPVDSFFHSAKDQVHSLSLSISLNAGSRWCSATSLNDFQSLFWCDMMLNGTKSIWYPVKTTVRNGNDLCWTQLTPQSGPFGSFDIKAACSPTCHVLCNWLCVNPELVYFIYI